MTLDTLALDRAYADGREDLAYKIVELLRAYDYEFDNYDLEEFLEAELGYTPEDLPSYPEQLAAMQNTLREMNDRDSD
jgi:hypothetical protein